MPDMLMIVFGYMIPLICGLGCVGLGTMEYMNSRGITIGIKLRSSSKWHIATPPGYKTIAFVQFAIGAIMLVIFGISLTKLLWGR